MILAGKGEQKSFTVMSLILILALLMIASTAAGNDASKVSLRITPSSQDDTGIVHVRGNISQTLYVDARAKGVPAPVIHEFISIMNGTVDFTRDIHRNDGFEMAYLVTRNTSGEIIGKGPLLYARLILEDHDHAFYRFERGEDRGTYYSPDGKSLHVNLKTSPLPGAIMASAFGKRRHPISGKWRKHEGIDLSAPSGTPVFATADGTVIERKHSRSYGNKVEVQHTRNYVTTYAHLKAFAPNLKNGDPVQRGQIIGYVGSTGHSTGPHLHYEVRIGSRHIDPVTVQKHSDWDLIGSETTAFNKVRRDIDQLRGVDKPGDFPRSENRSLPATP